MRTRSSSPALQNGLLFGVILGGIEIVLFFLLGDIGFILNFFIFLFIVGYAGYRASARTGKVSTGLVAGLLVGLLSAVIASIPLLVYCLSIIDQLRVQFQQQMASNQMYQGVPITNNLVIASVILLLVVVIIASTLIALGIGSIGGAIGKGRAPAFQAPQYPEPVYAPPYPPQGYMPPPPQEYTPTFPPQDYTKPEVYMSPQENTPPKQE